jgi:hypothetical protein
MTITSTDSDPALKSNLPQYWVFSCSLPAAVDSDLRDKQSKFADFINISMKKSWPRSKTLIQVRPATMGKPKPAPEVRGMIWIVEDMVLEDITVQNLQTKIERQARKLDLEIVDEAVPTVSKLELLSHKTEAGNWAYSSITDLRSTLSCFVRDIPPFVDLITVRISD